MNVNVLSAPETDSGAESNNADQDPYELLPLSLFMDQKIPYFLSPEASFINSQIVRI